LVVALQAVPMLEATVTAEPAANPRPENFVYVPRMPWVGLTDREEMTVKTAVAVLEAPSVPMNERAPAGVEGITNVQLKLPTRFVLVVVGEHATPPDHPTETFESDA